MQTNKLRIKGHEFDCISIKDSFYRKAVQIQNKIIEALKEIGVKEDDIIIELEKVAMKKAPASASWYLDGHHQYYSYKSGSKYVENLYVVYNVIMHEVNAVLNEQKTIEEFANEFSESHNVEDERKEAREILGVEPDTLDMDAINKKYKLLAKECHPDMPNGDTEKFKKLNKAHKILKRELE
jgi:hypothetical protein